MTGVQHLTVATDEADLRLDRWFRRRFPDLSHVRLEKLLRTGQVRIDGRRAKAGERLQAGQAVRVPPFGAEPPPRPTVARAHAVSAAEAEELRGRILHMDADVIAIDKPAGLAVQGGTGTDRHLDGMLDVLQFDATERPRLVHRLDRDTSGVMLLARSARAADRLGRAFRGRDARKVYWAITVGVPNPRQGRIDLPLAKTGGRGYEKMSPDPEEGRSAITLFTVLETAGKRLAWVALWPRTGRTHQLRAHMAAIGTPILGDGKYAGAEAHLHGIDLARTVHLHARSIALPHPSGSGSLFVEAPLPPHLAETFGAFGFEPRIAPRDPFEGAS
ncbi:MAG: RluA family pseudouridine synthase [Alphaproteobacteria bacterium]